MSRRGRQVRQGGEGGSDGARLTLARGLPRLQMNAPLGISSQTAYVHALCSPTERRRRLARPSIGAFSPIGAETRLGTMPDCQSPMRNLVSDRVISRWRRMKAGALPV
jgi:hypothetical protein